MYTYTVLAFMALVRWAVVGYYEQKVRASDAQLTRVLARHIERSIRSEDEVIGMLSDYYLADKTEGLILNDD